MNTRHRHWAFSFCMALSTLLASVAEGQVIDPAFPVTNYPPSCVHLYGDTLYVGGDFTYMGPATGPLAAIDLVTGAPSETWPAVGGQILAIEPDGDGGCFVGMEGRTFLSGVPRLGLAHIRRDGSLDALNGSGPYTTIRALAHAGSRLFVAGWSLSAEHGAGPEVGCFDLISHAYATIAPVDGEVTDLLVHGDTLYVAGSFRTLAGVARNGLGEIDLVTGRVTSFVPGFEGRVECLGIWGDTLWVGGNFSDGAGTPAVNLAAFDTRTHARVVPSLRTDIWVRGIALDDASAYAIGFAPPQQDPIRTRIAAWDHAGRARSQWAPEFASFPRSHDVFFESLAVANGVVYVGGWFELANGVERHNLAALSAATGATLPWTCHSGGIVYGLELSRGRLLSRSYSNGSFGGSVRRGVGAIDVRTKRVLDWRPALESSWHRPIVFDFARVGSRVFLGGEFDRVGGQFHLGLCAVDAISGSPEPASIDVTEGTAYGPLLARDSVLYVGGGFVSVSNLSRTGLAALDLRTMRWTSWAPRLSWGVGQTAQMLPAPLNMVARESTLIVNGLFAYANGQPRTNTAEFDMRTGAVTDYQDPSGLVRWDALLVGNEIWYVGDGVGPQGRPTLEFVPLEGPTNRPTTGLESFGTMKALARQGDVVWVTGDYGRRWPWETAEADSGSQLTAVDVATHRDLNWSKPFYYFRGAADAGGVTIAADSEAAYAGGNFALADGYSPILLTMVRVLRPDSLAPHVAMLAPSGGETIVTGSPYRISWEATDDRGITSADLHLSKNGGDWTLLAAGIRGRSWYDWSVDPSELAQHARVRVVVRDWDGKPSEAMSPEFAIADPATPTWLERFRVTRFEAGVRVEWSLAEPAADDDAAIERATSPDGSFSRVDAPISAEGRLRFLVDADAPSDRAWWYRVRCEGRDGSTHLSAPVALNAAGGVLEFALGTASPNPTRGASRVSYALPRPTRVRITLLDVQGRERARLIDGQRPAGAHEAELDARDLAPGLYWLRMQAGGRDLRTKLVIAR